MKIFPKYKDDWIEVSEIEFESGDGQGGKDPIRREYKPL